MNARVRDYPLDALSGEVVGAALRVRASLGFGCREEAYSNELALEMGRCGLDVSRQSPDLVIDGELAVEIKAVAALGPPERIECLGSLRANQRSVCLLLNFGDSGLEVERIVALS